jgi:hypothetical protein
MSRKRCWASGLGCTCSRHNVSDKDHAKDQKKHYCPQRYGVRTSLFIFPTHLTAFFKMTKGPAVTLSKAQVKSIKDLLSRHGNDLPAFLEQLDEASSRAAPKVSLSEFKNTNIC